MSDGDWFPEGKRFGVMCVRGFSDLAGSGDYTVRSGSRHAFDFWIVDLVELGRTVRKFTGGGDSLEEPTVDKARRRAIRHAAKLNKLDRAHDRSHAPV